MSELFKITFLALVLLVVNFGAGHAQTDTEEQHTEVVMRMIGHEILLNADDSTSRVLPISKIGHRYKIPFEAPFAFQPDTLASTIDWVITKGLISKHYIVEMESCESGEIVYGYEIGTTIDTTMVPCLQRAFPKECYTLFITLLDAPLSRDAVTASNSGSYFSENSLWIILLLIVVALGFYFLRKRRTPTFDPNIINLGKYHFDKLNSELLFENQRIELSGKEADLLTLLYDTVNTTVEREVILKLIWGDNGDYIGRTLDVFISKLRKKLESDPRVKIVNIRGVGYKLVMDGREN